MLKFLDKLKFTSTPKGCGTSRNLANMKKNIFIGIGLFLGIAMTGMAMAGSVSFYPATATLLEGNSFSSSVSVNPGSEKIYSVKVVLNYPVDKFEITGFNFSDGWMSGFSPEDKIDNTNGVLVKTAGWPGGTSDIKSLGTISFKSKVSGTGEVLVSSDSMLLNGQNNNVISLANPAISVTINEPEPVEEVISEPEVSTTEGGEVVTGVSNDEEVIEGEDEGDEETVVATTEGGDEILRSEVDLEENVDEGNLLATVMETLFSGMGITLIILIIVVVSVGISIRKKKK